MVFATLIDNHDLMSIGIDTYEKQYRIVRLLQKK